MQNKSSTAAKSLIQGFFHLYPEETARLLNTFSMEETLNYLQVVPVSRATQIFARLNPEFAAELVDNMKNDFFARLFTLIDPSLAARLLSRLPEEKIKNRLSLLPTSVSKEINGLMEYPQESAGYLMDPRVLVFHPDDTVKKTLKRIRTIRDRRILNINVVNEDGKLVGLIPLQEVAISPSNEQLKNLLRGQAVTIPAMSSREEVIQLIEEQKLISLPVVDFNGNLLGIIRNDALVRAAKQDASEDLQSMFGAGREERAMSKVSFAIRKRLPWLEINLATAFLAAAVVGIFEDTIARITVLAVFLPVVAGQSGNTGSQALAVTMRGLALREIHTRHWFQVARKEILVGFINGCASALTTSLIVFYWADSFGLAVIIAAAMVISMVIAGLSGAVIPILLKAIGQDPAQSSSIILTTITDVVGFSSFLGLASALTNVLKIA